MTQTITIPASLFSSFIGRHKRRSQDDAIREIYEKYVLKDHEYFDIPLPHQLDYMVDKVRLDRSDYKKLFSMDPVETVHNGIKVDLEPAHLLAIMRGIALEETALDELNRIFEEQDKPYRARRHKKPYRTMIDGIELSGVVDALIYDFDDNVIGVVEIKNRLHGIFCDDKLESYMYDIDQLMCYHKLLGKSSEILILAQLCNGKLKYTEYDKNYMDRRWNSIRNYIKGAVDRYREIEKEYKEKSNEENIDTSESIEDISDVEEISNTEDVSTEEYTYNDDSSNDSTIDKIVSHSIPPGYSHIYSRKNGILGRRSINRFNLMIDRGHC